MRVSEVKQTRFKTYLCSQKSLGKQQRAGAHTDYGSLTILLPQEGTSGLQIKHGDDWIDVPAPKNCFVINIGDLIWWALGIHAS